MEKTKFALEKSLAITTEIMTAGIGILGILINLRKSLEDIENK